MQHKLTECKGRPMRARDWATWDRAARALMESAERMKADGGEAASTARLARQARVAVSVTLTGLARTVVRVTRERWQEVADILSGYVRAVSSDDDKKRAREEARQRAETVRPMQMVAARVVAEWDRSQQKAEQRRQGREAMRGWLILCVRGWRAVVEARGDRPAGLKLIWVGEEMKEEVYAESALMPGPKLGGRHLMMYARLGMAARLQVRATGQCAVRREEEGTGRVECTCGVKLETREKWAEHRTWIRGRRAAARVAAEEGQQPCRVVRKIKREGKVIKWECSCGTMCNARDTWERHRCRWWQKWRREAKTQADAWREVYDPRKKEAGDAQKTGVDEARGRGEERQRAGEHGAKDVIGRKQVGGRLLYQVRWKGAARRAESGRGGRGRAGRGRGGRTDTAAETVTWEPAENLAGSRVLAEDYDHRAAGAAWAAAVDREEQAALRLMRAQTAERAAKGRTEAARRAARRETAAAAKAAETAREEVRKEKREATRRMREMAEERQAAGLVGGLARSGGSDDDDGAARRGKRAWGAAGSEGGGGGPAGAAGSALVQMDATAGETERRVRAAVRIEKGDRIGEYVGKVVGEAEAAERRRAGAAGMLIEVAPGEYVDGGACAHYTRYIGEGADGNVEVEVEMATRRVDMYAARTIEAGEVLRRRSGGEAGMAEATGGTGAGERGACAGGRSGGGAGETKQGRAHGTAGGGGGAGTYSEPDTDEESEEESEWEEEGEHGAWEDGPPRAAAPERDK